MSQSLEAMRCEIDYRRKISEQQIKGVKYFDDELDDTAIIQVLREKMRATKEDMEKLRFSGVKFTPYLEVGAERCQRSMTMGPSGVATDLSMAMLRAGDHYAARLGETVPPRVCADLHHLPFKDNTFNFIFCYETIHHFPTPGEPIMEIYRVLRPGGYFWFAEEPYKNLLNIKLWRAGKLYANNQYHKSRHEQIIDHFLAAKSCNEVELGIIENDDITIEEWRRALTGFSECHVTLRAFGGRERPFDRPGIINTLIGGSIRGLCRK